MAEPPRTAMEGEGLDSSMEEGLTSLPAAAFAAAAAAFAAACEYPNTIGQTKFSSGHKNSYFKAFNLGFLKIVHVLLYNIFIRYLWMISP